MANSDNDLNDVWRLLMKGAMVLLMIAAFFGGCTYINSKLNLKDDNEIEDFIEDIVEFHLGLPEDTVDFTPQMNFEYE